MSTAAYVIIFILMILFKDQCKTILSALAGLINSIASTLVEAMKKR